MMSDFENTLLDFIEAHKLFEHGETILLAISGGADSTALLYALASLKKQSRLKNFFLCAHINHQLRGADADNDEKFVIEQAGKLALPVVTEKIDVPLFARQNKLSIETAARLVRLNSLLDIAGKENCRTIATAHQADDNAETVIHNILRGTGFRGLAGIRPKRKFRENFTFVSPLLCFTRKQIIEYLADNNLDFCEDRTNFDCKYKRNFIRHKLLPVIDEQSTAPLVEHLSQLSVTAGVLNDKVQAEVESIRAQVMQSENSCIKLNLEIFNTRHREVKIELIRQSLLCIGSGLGDLSSRQYNKILEIAGSGIGNKKISLPGGFSVINEYGNLCFFKSGCEMGLTEGLDNTVELKIPGVTRFGSFECKAELMKSGQFAQEDLKIKDEFTECLDFDKVEGALKVRRRRAGDRFQPIGLSDEKKVGKFLTDAKIPRRTRDKVFIIEDSEKIIWLWPVRISEKVKVTPKTKKILKFKITHE